MKTLFIIPLVLMSLVSSPSWALSEDDLVIRAGLYYEKFTATPVTGEVDEGVSKGSIKNGKMEGYWVISGLMLIQKGNYKNGKKEGSWETYWANGQLMLKGTYKNDKREGSWESYHKDGQLEGTGTYKNDVKVSD